MARSFGDELARIPAIIDSLVTTGGLDKYRENFKTSAEAARELAAAEKEAAEQAAQRKAKAEQAAVAEAAAIKALQAEYRQSAAEAASLETTLNTLRSAGRESSDMYAEFAVQLEAARAKSAELKKELDGKNAKISVDTGDLARATDALEKLGLSTQQVTTGMSENANQALDSFSTAARQFGNDADQMGRMFQAALSKMDSPEAVEALKGRLQEVSKEAGLTAEEIAKIGDQAPAAADKVAAAFAKIGVDTEAVMSGISSQSKQAMQDFQTASDEMAAAGQKNSALIRAGFEQMMGKLGSRQEFEAFRVQLEKSGDAAMLTKEQIERLNAAAQGGAQQAKTAYEDFARSIKTAADAADLSEVAQKAAQAFGEGSITAQQYEQIVAQVQARTEALNAKTAETGKKAEEGYGRATRAANQYTSAQQAAKTATEEAAKATETAATKTSDYGYRMSETHGWVKLTTEQMALMRKEFAGFKVGAEAETAIVHMKQWTEQIGNAREAMNALSASQRGGAVSAADLARATAAVEGAADKLGKTQLAEFRAAIDDARRRMENLKAAAQSATAELQAQLDELNGNAEAVQAYQHQRKVAELQAKLSEAQKYRQSEVAAEYSKQIRLLEQIYQKQKANRQAERAEAANAQNTSARTSGLNPADLARSGGVSVDIAALLRALAERDKGVGEQVVSQLEQAIKRAT